MKQMFIEVMIAFALSWLVAGALAGCTVDQAQAYQIIKGGK